MEIEISRSALEAMHAAASAALPCEACGILLGQGTRVSEFREATNVHPTPQTHFEIDPQALIDAHRQARVGGAQVLGYFHSHPSGLAKPSATDAAMAAGDGRIWAIWGALTEGAEANAYIDTSQGRYIDTLREKDDTFARYIDTSGKNAVTFWRDTDTGFAALSYTLANR